jgi:heptosyltransferase-2
MASAPGTQRSPGDPQRILVRSVNWLGDAVMTTPALRRLRERFPNAQIDLLTPAKLADLWTGHPDLSGVIAFRKEEGLLQVARQIRASRYDLALLFPNSHRVALEAWLARIPRRVGISRSGRNLLLTDVVHPPQDLVTMRKRTPEEIQALLKRGGVETSAKPGPESHHTSHYLRLVAALGAIPNPAVPFLGVASEEQEALRIRFQIDPQIRWIGINPGAEYGPAKRWPQERFVETAKRLAAAGGRGFLVFGGPADQAAAEGITRDLGSAAPVRVLAGKTSLRELCAGMSLCSVVLTNDTGPMHVAAAVGTPVVVPFGSTSIELTGPGLPGDPRHRLLAPEAVCAPCFLRECPVDFRCMRSHGVDRVTSAVEDLLAHRDSL